MPKDTLIRNNLELFYKPVKMPGDYYFDTVDTIKIIDLYYNSQFESGNEDSRGFRKLFYNIVNPEYRNAVKFVDIDTKDITLFSENADDELKLWLLSKDLKNWMKQNDIATVLNEIRDRYPKYGHVVVKKLADTIKVLEIQNIRTNPAAKYLKDSNFVYEVHEMYLDEMLSMPGWDMDAINELSKRSNKNGAYLIYECYDFNPNPGKKYLRTIRSDVFEKRAEGDITSTQTLNDEGSDYLPALILRQDEVDELPYRELKWEDVNGRWLGKGIIEDLLDNQIAENEAENLERKGLYFTSLKVYQTRDDSVGSNILTDVENGDILKVSSEVTPVANEERNLAAFNATRARWDVNTKRKTFAFEASTGETLPSRTPLGVANAQIAVSTMYYDTKRENYGIFLRKLILNDIIPMFAKQNRKEHVLVLAGTDSEIDKLDDAITDIMINQAAFDYAMKTGFVPSEEQRRAEREKIKKMVAKKNNRYLNIPDSFYENAKYSVDVNITGEQLDTQARIATLQVAMQIVGSNPAIIQDKVTRAILFKMLQLSGVSPIDIGLLEQKAREEMPQQMPMPQGGSISAPSGQADLLTQVSKQI